MAHLCFIPHPLTGEEAPHQGGLPEWAICDDEATLRLFLRHLCCPLSSQFESAFCSRAQLASLFFVVGMLRCPEPLIDRVQRRKVAFSPQTQLRAHNHFPGERPNALIAPPWALRRLFPEWMPSRGIHKTVVAPSCTRRDSNPRPLREGKHGPTP